MKKNPRIKRTRDYDKFGYMDANRSISSWNVKKLKRSVEKKNLLPWNPIIVNSDFEIIDGQHRLEVARQLDIYVYYVVCSSASMEEVKLMNDNVQKWTLRDYLESYITSGKRDYKKLKEYMEEYELTITMTAYILTRSAEEEEEDQYDRTTTIYGFRRGEFEILDEEYSKKIFENIARMRPYLKEEQNVYKHEYFVYALVDLMERVDFDKFMEKLKSSGKVIEKHFARIDYMRVFEDVWNYNRHKFHRIY